eukprot:g28834.t1
MDSDERWMFFDRGWDQMGDEDDPESDDEAWGSKRGGVGEALGESKGWRSTSDWVRRQSVEVEMMSAFPMMDKRDPMPKRVDVDMVVDSRSHGISNTRIVPPKAYGRPPSASSQMSLWGDDDYTYRQRKLWNGKGERHRITPFTNKKDFHSDALNSTIYNLKVTASAMYNMDDAGGFDNYILRTPPQDGRRAGKHQMSSMFMHICLAQT